MKNHFAEIEISYKPKKMMYGAIRHSEDVANILRPLFNKGTIEFREEFIALYMNKRNEILGYFLVSCGGMSATIADPKLIFSAALKAGACSVIIAHNHPSGNIEPSAEDKKLTSRVRSGGELLEIQLIDHIIITADNYFSFCDQGLLRE
jgi:DNA repair protein RadC